MKNGVLRSWSWRVTGVAALISLKLRNRLQKDSEVQTGIDIRKGRSIKVIWIMKPSSPLATTCSLAHFVHRQVLGAPVHWLIACIAAAWLGSMETQSRISWANLGSWYQATEMTPSIVMNLANLFRLFASQKIQLGSQVANKLILELQRFVLLQDLGIAVTRLENQSTWKIGCGESEEFTPVTVRRL